MMARRESYCATHEEAGLFVPPRCSVHPVALLLRCCWAASRCARAGGTVPLRSASMLVQCSTQGSVVLLQAGRSIHPFTRRGAARHSAVNRDHSTRRALAHPTHGTRRVQEVVLGASLWYTLTTTPAHEARHLPQAAAAVDSTTDTKRARTRDPRCSACICHLPPVARHCAVPHGVPGRWGSSRVAGGWCSASGWLVGATAVGQQATCSRHSAHATSSSSSTNAPTEVATCMRP